jgi:hypothetical protein
MKKSRPSSNQSCTSDDIKISIPQESTRGVHTDDQTLHLIFPHYFHIQSLLYLIVELVCPASSRDDKQLALISIPAVAISLSVLDGQAAHELQAGIYAVGGELDEIESTAEILGRFFKAPVANFD